MERETYYDILGVSPAASPDQIRAKYRALTQRVHPDVGGPIALFRLVQESYEVLSDPERRASYDRSLAVAPAPRARTLKPWPAEPTAAPHPPPRRPGAPPPRRNSTHVPDRRAGRIHVVRSLRRDHPARVAAIAGAGFLAVGAALGPDAAGWSALLLGLVVLVMAMVAGFGGRGVKEREAYQRGGMAAVDAMTGRQFRALLEYFFARQGYRVARLGARRNVGADLLISDPRGHTIVQVKRSNGVVASDAVQRAMVAKARYRVSRVLLVTSSTYSEQAVTAANSNGVTLWNRATLANELSLFDGSAPPSGLKRLPSDLHVGTRMCLHVVAALFMAVLAASSQQRGEVRSRGDQVSSQP